MVIVGERTAVSLSIVSLKEKGRGRVRLSVQDAEGQEYGYVIGIWRKKGREISFQEEISRNTTFRMFVPQQDNTYVPHVVRSAITEMMGAIDIWYSSARRTGFGDHLYEALKQKQDLHVENPSEENRNRYVVTKIQ